jgi:hypothetical protein
MSQAAGPLRDFPAIVCRYPRRGLKQQLYQDATPQEQAGTGEYLPFDEHFMAEYGCFWMDSATYCGIADTVC